MADIGIIALDLSHIGAQDWPRLRDPLDGDERARAARFMFDDDRCAYVAAHGLLRLALSRQAAVAPRNWRFAAGAHGKPYLVDAPIDLRFSLSHTRGMVAVAIAKGAEIGVDVEGPRGVSDAMKLAERYFTTPEVALLRDTPEGDARREIFLRIWTLKEAVIKAVGEGLVFGLERFSVRTDPPSVAFNDGEDRGEWTLALWRRGEFHIAAAVCGDRKKMPREPDDAAALIRSAAEP